MEQKKINSDEQELRAALGAPKSYLSAPVLDSAERYFWFPTLGDSMTDHTPKSIPSGSMVLGRLLQLNTISDIPLHRPIVVIIDDEGTQFCMLKSACAIKENKDAHTAALCLRSYNPAPRCADFWMPFSTSNMCLW